MKLKFHKLRKYPALQQAAAQWFSQKWNIPLKAYTESISTCIQQQQGIPQWYVLCDNTTIVAGAGVIENDFHNRKDLSPNLCALFVEPPYRQQGIARYLLDSIRKDLYPMGIETLYLVTDHTTFYEKCGWSFLTMVIDTENIPIRMYQAKTLAE